MSFLLDSLQRFTQRPFRAGIDVVTPSPEMAKIIPSVDITPFVEQHTEDERKIVLDNMGSQEATHGCSSGCSDCYLKAPVGVRSQITLNSLDKLYATYGTEITHIIVPYNASDFMDWEGDPKGPVALYLLHRKYDHEDPYYVSTYFPLGKEPQMALLMEEMIKDLAANPSLQRNIRFSLRRKTIDQRIEERIQLYERLQFVQQRLIKKLGKKDEPHINHFFQNNIHSNGDNYLRTPLGRDFDKHNKNWDKFRDIATPGCYDGVVLSPHGFYASTLDAISPYNPKGAIEWDIVPGINFEVSKYVDSHSQRIVDRCFGYCVDGPVFMPGVTVFVKNGSEIVEQERFSMSRELLSFRKFIEGMVGIKNHMEQGENIYPEGMYSLLVKAQDEYSVKRTRIIEKMSPGASSEKESYFFDLASQYLKLMDFLFSRISKKDLSPISIIAMFYWVQTLGYNAISTRDLEADFSQEYKKYADIDRALNIHS